MGQALTRIFLIFYFFGFCVVFMFPNVSKNLKNWIGGGWVLSDQSEFFSDFGIFFNLTKPLTNVYHRLAKANVSRPCKENKRLTVVVTYRIKRDEIEVFYTKFWIICTHYVYFKSKKELNYN